MQIFLIRIANIACEHQVWWTFAIAGLLTIGIAMVTVSYQSVKAVLGNPVKSLGTE